MMRRALFIAGLLVLAGCEQARPSQDAPEGPVAPPVEAAAEVEAPPSTTDAAAVPSREKTGTIHTPAPGSAERSALMDALRGAVEAELGGRAEFVVNTLRSDGEWAFAEVEPQWPGGRRIVAAETPLYRAEPDWPFDGLHTEAIFRKVDGRWQVLHHSIGSTDVWWVEHCRALPRGILTGC